MALFTLTTLYHHFNGRTQTASDAYTQRLFSFTSCRLPYDDIAGVYLHLRLTSLR